MITLAHPDPVQERPPSAMPRRIWGVVVFSELGTLLWPEGIVIERASVLLSQFEDELPGNLWTRWCCQSHIDQRRRARGLTPYLAELEPIARRAPGQSARYLVHRTDRRVAR